MSLAVKLRPQTLIQVVGQEHLTKKGTLFYNLLHAKTPTSILLWGPPGCGKTTLAKIYQDQFDATKASFSATSAKVSDIKQLVDQIRSQPLFHKKILLFLDEIHRFNKLQQDLFLPLIEEGSLILIGATTENPSFALNKALLSRLNIFILNALEKKDFFKLLQDYEKTHPLPLTDEAKEKLISLAAGDARIFYNLLESLEKQQLTDTIDVDTLEKKLPHALSKYDRQYDYHYFFISALHKSVRGSDPDAALYYLARMLNGGEDRLYLLRRLIRMAAEDIGLSDPNALTIATNALLAFEKIGSPEGDLFLAEVVLYLALCPKSNAIYTAFNKATEFAKETSEHMPPPWILNAPTQWMKAQGFSKGYIYEHDEKGAISSQKFFPEKLTPQTFYSPTSYGFEKELKKRIEYFNQLREKP
ncbi:MAG: Replication-associated recombination protein A [Chlamydiae bacterium]|nr:Replication-associated recombination protein A [Chlamydiota bacterium]